MSFRRIAKQHFRSDQELRYKARQQALNPEKISIYPSNKVPKRAKKTISRLFNSFEISDRARFTLRAYGIPFNYQGIVTKSYSTKTVLKLFHISYSTLYKWLQNGILPSAFVKLEIHNGVFKNYWFYHQVQPVYSWYMHMCARGIERIKPEYYLEEMDILKRLLIAQEKRWYAKLGVRYPNLYADMCGKYGVIHLQKDEKSAIILSNLSKGSSK